MSAAGAIPDGRSEFLRLVMEDELAAAFKRLMEFTRGSQFHLQVSVVLHRELRGWEKAYLGQEIKIDVYSERRSDLAARSLRLWRDFEQWLQGKADDE
jgi:hypothetical protein